MLSYGLFMFFHILNTGQSQAKINVKSSLKEKVYYEGRLEEVSLSSIMANCDYRLILCIRITDGVYFYHLCQYLKESCLSSCLSPTLNIKCIEEAERVWYGGKVFLS